MIAVELPLISLINDAGTNLDMLNIKYMEPCDLDIEPVILILPTLKILICLFRPP